MLSVWLGDFMPRIDFKDILLCWPNAGLSPARRWRLALWRALVIDHIAKTREAVIAKSIEAGARRAVHSSRGKVTDPLLEIVERLPLPPSQKLLPIP